ncbi:PREDICTED: nucleoporin Nup37, partial [Galeopterus variegatus]|uniref:Nucleoporin Nup37 n=2 Tax=Cynocephalidae TaxID=30657 RepID=A0ABM0S2A7_GALVR
IWNLEGMQTAHFVLHSPGMSVCWHPEETFKLMVAEKNGTIRFYDLLAQQAILSLESEQMPLMSAHWCLKNTFKVGAVAGNDWLIWDITRSSYPQDKRPVHMDQAYLFRWSTINENLFATTGYPGKMASQFQIHHLGHPQPILIGSVAVGSGLSWHRTLPLCAIGGDHKLLFWVTEM